MKKNISILHTESSCGWGGQEIRILTESQECIRRGHYVELLCSKKSTIFEEAKRLSIPVSVINMRKKTLLSLISTLLWLKNNHKRFHVVNTHSSTDSWLIALSKTILRINLPIVRTRHVSTPINIKVSTSWLYTKATAFIVTTGQKIKETLVNDNKFNQENIVSIPTGICFSRFYPRDKQECLKSLEISLENKFVVGIVATLRDWKGHLYLLQAIKGLSNKHNNIVLVIVGDGPQDTFLKAKIQELGLEKHVIMVGKKDNVEIWMNIFDVFCLPSYGEEGVPQSIIQALASRIPVISTSVGSISEVVIDNVSGIIVQPKDSQGIALALDKLINSSQLRTYLAENGVNLVRQHFSIGSMVDGMEHVFYTVIKE